MSDQSEKNTNSIYSNISSLSPFPQSLAPEIPSFSHIMSIRSLQFRKPPVHLRLHSQMLRYIRRTHRRRRPQDRLLAFNTILLGILLLGIVLPIGLSSGYLLQSAMTLNTLRIHATSGIGHLEDVKNLFSSQVQSQQQQTSVFDAGKLTQAHTDLIMAHSDFVQIQKVLDQSQWLQNVPQTIPQLEPYFTTARAASQIGIDLTTIGENVTSVGLTLAPGIQSGLLSSGNTPLLTSNDLKLITTMLNQDLPLLENMQAQTDLISLDVLPINATTRTQIEGYLQMLPQIITSVKTASSLTDVFGWVLGIGQPRTFLVQPMDSGELRATGGFTGQYGKLQINGGRVAPLTLQNIAILEYSSDSSTFGNQTPPAYRTWWPFANWGLRDSNLSADVPTSAKYALETYQSEVSSQLDGVITFTPTTIEDVLNAVGPIKVPRYGEMITAQNLENRLHYYQLDNAGIRREEIIEHVDDPQQARKLFTSEVERILMNRIRQAAPGELFVIGRQMLQDLQTRDLQVYFTNPQVENLLIKYGYAGQMNRNPNQDGLYIVQDNVSVSKASQYVKTMFQDNVQLDAKGGATHQLTLHFNYQQTGPVYGFDTYRDYVRIYVPPSAQLRSGDGFDTDTPLCGGPYQACPSTNVYLHNELVCPQGQYKLGEASAMLNDPYIGDHPLDTLGPPTNTQSDESGRAMFGGYVVIPKNCQMTVTVSWYVPAITHKNTYNFFLQRQAGTNPEFTMTVRTVQCGTSKPGEKRFSSNMARDALFSVQLAQQGNMRCG